MKNICLSCRRGFHNECGDPCCCPTSESEGQIKTNAEDSGSLAEDRDRRDRGRPKKHDTEIGVSAGRKRAAIEYEIDSEAPCEWRDLANCGGGKFPIVGCLTGKQKHRHHGPVKATYRNEEGNVHRICTGCHNLWHAKNDPIYDADEYEQLPHDPRRATPYEQLSRGKS